MPIEAIVQTIAKELRACPFLKGVVLGGSRATGCATESSDIDIGLYYEGAIDYGQLNAIAQRLDDAPPGKTSSAAKANGAIGSIAAVGSRSTASMWIGSCGIAPE